MRKNFVTSELVAIATAMIPKYEGRNHRPIDSDKSGNISLLTEQGQTRDIVAAKVGLGCGKTYEAAKKVVENGAPELVRAMDEGKVTISAAVHMLNLPLSDQSAIDYEV